mgnify:CR=1 FL=1
MLIDKDGRMSQDYRVTISQFLRTNHSQGGRTLNILDLTDTSMCVIEDYSDKLSGMTHDSWLQTGHSATHQHSDLKKRILLDFFVLNG